jgi:hypothetical protein
LTFLQRCGTRQRSRMACFDAWAGEWRRCWPFERSCIGNSATAGLLRCSASCSTPRLIKPCTARRQAACLILSKLPTLAICRSLVLVSGSAVSKRALQNAHPINDKAPRIAQLPCLSYFAAAAGAQHHVSELAAMPCHPIQLLSHPAQMENKLSVTARPSAPQLPVSCVFLIMALPGCM